MPIQEIKGMIKAGAWKDAYQLMKVKVKASDDYTQQSRFARLFQALEKKDLDLTPIRIALLGSSTLDHFATVFKLWLGLAGFDSELYLSEFDTIHQTVLDANSELYEFEPDVIWLFTNYRDIKISGKPGEDFDTLRARVEGAISDQVRLWNVIRQRTSAFVIQNNADLPAERIFGNYEGAAMWSQANLFRLYNLRLAEEAPSGVTIFDLDHTASLYGKRLWNDPRFWFHSKHAFALDATGLVALHGAQLVSAIKGKSKKCLVLDLDDTLWGGVIGDDGLEGISLGSGAKGEAFADFQKYLHSLQERGILLAVCSKNDETTAKEPFVNHPDMCIRLDDISVFVANWDNKADNIRQIASTLNLGLDSFVFVDDNPVERELIRTELPTVTVPDMPQDPADYVSALDYHRLFETVSFSKEDLARTRMYKENAERQEFRQQCTDIAGYLKALEMEAMIGSCDDFHIGRISQLINKSNQFHLTGTRYGVSDLEAMKQDPNRFILHFNLKDRFGDNGLISVVILCKENDLMSIDTWVMSCRVLSRGMEEFICRELLAVARHHNCFNIQGCYVPSKKNRLVAGLYDKLGFTKVSESENGITHWVFPVTKEDPFCEIYIKRAECDYPLWAVQQS